MHHEARKIFWRIHLYYGLQITCRFFFAEKLELHLFTPPFMRCCKFPASSASKKPTSDVQTYDTLGVDLSNDQHFDEEA